MVDEHVEDVLDVRVADEVHAQLAQRVGLRCALHRRPPLAFELSRHVSGRQRDHEEQEHLADRRVGIDVEVGRREAAADEQIKKRDDERRKEARRRAEPHRGGDHGQEERQEERAAETVRQVDDRGREKDVEDHRREAELLPRAVAADEQDLDRHVQHRPAEQDGVDDDLRLRTGVRVQVVQGADDDEEQPPEDKGDALAGATPVCIEGRVDGLGAHVLPPRRLFLAGGLHRGHCARSSGRVIRV